MESRPEDWRPTAGRLYRVRSEVNRDAPYYQMTMSLFEQYNITVLPVGTLVVAHYVPPDQGWPKVVPVSQASAKYRTEVWVHPDSLECVIGPAQVHVKRCKRANTLPVSYVPMDIYHRHGTFDGDALDCRWDRGLRDTHDFANAWSGNRCTGHCPHVALEVMNNDNRLSDILQGACWARDCLVVFCDRGKHRSMSAAELIKIFTGANIIADYPPHWCSRCPPLTARLVVDALLTGPASGGRSVGHMPR